MQFILRSIALFFAAFCCASLCLSAENEGAKKRPNILFLFTDDQRADTIGALGNSHIQTPNLDQLAKEGTAFSRCYCMGSANGGAVCVPSRAMLMTGRTLFRVQEQMKTQTTWPEKFAEAGYTTFATGKWHNGQDSMRRVFQDSQGVFFGGMTNPYSTILHNLGKDRAFQTIKNDDRHVVQIYADDAIHFLKQQKTEKPFLCYVAFNLPHDPKIAPREYHAMYPADSIPLPANFLPQHPFNNGEMTVRDEQLEKWPRTPAAIRQHLADYYACVSFLDAEIGRILKALKDSGQYDNTLIVFTSDHGLALGSHGLMGKQNLYDHSMRSPLIMSGTGILKGEKRDAMCYLLDLFPTLGDLAQVPAPEGSEGLSLVPVLTGKQTKLRDSIFTAYIKVQRAIRDDRWKLIVYPQINKTQLFDLQNDPYELKDLAPDNKYADQVTRLTNLLKVEQQKAGDKQPLQVEKPQSAEFDFTKVKTEPPKKKAE